MFKILITTTARAGSTSGVGVSAHSLVVEFTEKEAADIAIKIINEKCSAHYAQQAIALY